MVTTGGAYNNGDGLAQDGAVTLTGKQNYSKVLEVVKLINAERAKEGLSALKLDIELTQAAMQRAAETFVFFSHTRPSGDKYSSLNAKINGENIGGGCATPKDIMDGWMNSAGHRANILNEHWKSVGVGCFYHNGVYHWVQLFSAEPATESELPSDTKTTVTVTMPDKSGGAFAPQLKMTQASGGGLTTTLKAGKTEKLGAVIINSGFTEPTLNPESLAWTTSDARLATIDKSGVLTGKAGGQVKVTARIPATAFSVTTTFTIQGAPPKPEENTATDTIPATKPVMPATPAKPQITAGWKKSGGKWWYQRADGTYPKNRWQKIDGEWYLFDGAGYLRTGWQKVSGKWYYLGTDGAMTTGWQKVGGVWYNFGTSGVMTTGWLKDGGAWYYFDSSGAMATGWQKLGGKWYFFYPLNQAKSGVMATGTVKINNVVYQFAGDGHWLG